MKIYVLGTRGIPGIQGGIEKHCEELYPRIARYGINFTLFARTSYVAKALRTPTWNNISIRYIWAPRKKSIETISHTSIASFICLFERPDIAHFHNTGPAVFIPLLRLFGIRTVLTYHNVSYTHQKWGLFAKLILRLGEHFSAKFADKIIAVSAITKEMIQNKYGRKDIEVIPNGVIIFPKTNSTANIEKNSLKHGGYVFAASRFTPEKGILDLISAYKILKKPDFKLVIAGDADYETDYSKSVKNSAKEYKDIILTGFLEGEILREYFSHTGLFVLPSHFEGLSIALLDALSYGLPTLVSDIPQNRSIGLDEKRYFKAGDIGALAEKMNELWKSGICDEEKNRYEKMMKELYDWDNIANRTKEVYEQIR
jgi:glycosyltransferase involved in cell wall biosynthesis